jgi:hypothetical protein
MALKTVPSPISSQGTSSGTGTQGACDEPERHLHEKRPVVAPSRNSRSSAAKVNWSGMVTQLKGSPHSRDRGGQHRVEPHPRGFRPVQRDLRHHRRGVKPGVGRDVEQRAAAAGQRGAIARLVAIQSPLAKVAWLSQLWPPRVGARSSPSASTGRARQPRLCRVERGAVGSA